LSRQIPLPVPFARRRAATTLWGVGQNERSQRGTRSKTQQAEIAHRFFRVDPCLTSKTEIGMDVTDQLNAIREKAHQMSRALWSLAAAAIAAYIVETFVGAPWWVYVMFFVRAAIGFATALTDEPAMRKAPDDRFGERPVSDTDTVIDLEASAFAWEASGLPD
jgi:hypothetical protein